MSRNNKPGFGRVVMAIFGCIALVAIIAQVDKRIPASSPKPEEGYNLIFTLGNTEKISASGLTWAECEKRKKELKLTAEGLGTYSERLGHGSIVCISDSAYD